MSPQAAGTPPDDDGELPIRTPRDFVLCLGDAIEAGELWGVVGLDDVDACEDGTQRVALVLTDETRLLVTVSTEAPRPSPAAGGAR